jgi:hypothetical protein
VLAHVLGGLHQHVGVMTKPQVDRVWATASGVLPTSAAGLFIAK